MIEMQDAPAAPPVRRRRWVMPVVVVVVALAGIGVGVAVARRDDASTSGTATISELADITQACTTWMNGDARWGPTSADWCQDMTGWMGQQVANGSMMGSMVWSDPEQMLSTCRAWMDAKPSSGRPAQWCDSMMRGMWPHMNGDWDHWDEQMNGLMMGG